MPPDDVETPPVDAPPAPEPEKNERLDRLEDLVNTLVTTVTALVPPDHAVVPKKVPWTHRGGRK